MTLSRVLKPQIVLAVLAGGGYAEYRYVPRGPAPDSHLLGTVERRDLTIKVTVSGGVVPRRMALITPPYNGYVKKLYVGVGQEVKAGAAVVSIAQTVGTADEEVFPLRSPITGRVVMLNREEGEYVTTTGDSTIVRIDDLGKLFVEANVPEIEVSKLQLGLPVVVRAVALPQKTYNGKIVEIAQSAKNQENWEKSKVEFPMRIELTDPDADLRSGMSCVLDIIVKDAKGVLALPHEFVQRDGRQYFVTTESGARKDIEVGMQNEEAFEIKAGVAEGERIRQVDFLKLAEKGAAGAAGGKMTIKK
jgi:multidrug efflux pump subunit AcrA (membrane-fusion protein)